MTHGASGKPAHVLALRRAPKGYDVVVVGPAIAPARARGVARVDRLLASLSRQHDLQCILTSDLDLTYLADGLHLTPAGHRAPGPAWRRWAINLLVPEIG